MSQGIATQKHEQQQRADRANRKLARDLERDADFQWLMSDERGRRIIADIALDDCNYDGDGFSTNAAEMGRKCTFRFIADRLRKRVDAACPERWLQMCEEHKQQ